MLKRYLEAGMAFTEMTRARAEGIAGELVKAGELQRDQMQSSVDELIDRSRRNTQQLISLVRQEVTGQLSLLGLATKDDLDALERRLTDKFGKAGGSKTTAAKTTAAKTTAAKTVKAASKSSKSSTTASSGAGKGPAKKSPTKRAPAKKAPAKKSSGS
jgi:polyhydroxyalkanoate synthesis regulator phasin